MSHTQSCQCSECLTNYWRATQRRDAGSPSEPRVDVDLEVVSASMGGWSLVALLKTRTFENTGITTRGLVPVLRIEGIADTVISIAEARLLVSMADANERSSDAMETKMEKMMTRIKSVLGEPVDLASRYGVPKSDT